MKYIKKELMNGSGRQCKSGELEMKGESDCKIEVRDCSAANDKSLSSILDAFVQLGDSEGAWTTSKQRSTGCTGGLAYCNIEVRHFFSVLSVPSAVYLRVPS
jgi:hypothetical protein